MHGISGLDATLAILDAFSKSKVTPCPIIGLTGDSGEEMKRKAIDSGMAEVLVKPLTKEDVRMCIGQHMNLQT